MTNYDIIKIVNLVLNNDVNGNAFTPDEYKTIINAQSEMLFQEYLGLTQEYQPNAPIPRNGVDASRMNVEDLREFLKTDDLTITGGSATLPDDMAYLLALNPSTISGRGFDEITAYEIADRLGSAVVAPTEDDPVFYRLDGGLSISVHPSTITSATLFYYKYPTQANFTITADPTTLLPVYTSIQELEWSDKSKVTIAYRILKDAGVNLENQMAFQDAVRTIETGK
jgi:hypothetical protein